MKLSVELVPQSSWGNNLRSEANIPRSEWDVLRKKCYKDAGYVCEICGGKGNRHPVECHEKWEYNDQTKTQKLVGLIALCPTCHKAKHLGRTLSVDEGKDRVLMHMMKVNEMSVDDLESYIVEVFQVWQERSGHAWKLDLSWLDYARGWKGFESKK